MRYADLMHALKVLGIEDRSTLNEIKARHRELVRECHPDRVGGDPERMRLVNAAYRLLTEYLAEYRFSFSEEDFYRRFPEERLRRQFDSDPLWGGIYHKGDQD